MSANKRILIYQVDSPYGALQSFMDQLMDALQNLGASITVVDFRQKNGMEQLAEKLTENFDAVLSFNCYIANIRLQDGSYLQDHINAPYYYFLVDHPMHHHKILCEKLKNLHALCVDQYFIEYINTYYPHIKSVDMIAHGGITDGNWIPYMDRKIDVLFTGSYKDCNDLMKIMENSPEPARTISLEMTKELLSHIGLRQEEAFSNVLDRLNIQIDNEAYAEWLSIIGNVVDHYIRGVYRNKMLEAMSNEPYAVEVYGSDWEQCSIQASNIHYHEAVDYEENLRLMNDAKIVLNTYTGFQHGAHERIFSTMLAKALCLTDTNEYIDEHFRDRENLVVFSYQDMQGYKDLIRYYLDHMEEAEKIAEAGYGVAVKEHTWMERAKQIVELL